MQYKMTVILKIISHIFTDVLQKCNIPHNYLYEKRTA